MRNAESCNSAVGSKLLDVVIVLGIFMLGLSFTASAQDAPATFKAKCAMCHGTDAAEKNTIVNNLKIPNLKKK